MWHGPSDAFLKRILSVPMTMLRAALFFLNWLIVDLFQTGKAKYILGRRNACKWNFACLVAHIQSQRHCPRTSVFAIRTTIFTFIPVSEFGPGTYSYCSILITKLSPNSEPVNEKMTNCFCDGCIMNISSPWRFVDTYVWQVLVHR